MKAQKNFKCKRCGACCFSPRISSKEIEIIENKYKINRKDFIYTLRKGFHYINAKRNRCIFLKKGKISTCTIHPYRPKVCRLYPSELTKRGSCKPQKLHFDKVLRKLRRKK